MSEVLTSTCGVAVEELEAVLRQAHDGVRGVGLREFVEWEWHRSSSWTTVLRG